ncbi:branched-chain amino acid aminotransferase II [Pleomassaria siparia CBS 279.74]|uniref:Branched-chain-amino-acid aminotransferase n=1 Tax=Pleomassaria siparia CBS 279.74 TaxID=1314801 RepID=A0A6G1K9D1_9PLEO|nr:branched-chain amino acid aminotransferase II [Pleomassaria siparia CBS 279.74]
MAPIAITPPLNIEPTVSELTAQGIQHALSKSAPSHQKSHNGLVAKVAQLDASLLTTALTTSPRSVPDMGSAEMASQKVCTDHMIQAQWSEERGWEAPSLQPYGPLSLMPTSSCLHYATQCFEGMKLYRGHDGKLRLFRPQLNCKRMLMSTTRIALPGFQPEELLKLIVKLCATDGPKWLPKDRPGAFLYIRPAMIGTDFALGVQRPREALLFVMLTCFAPMDDIPGGVKLLASQDDMCRAWPGGFGYAKVGANYGPSLVAQGEAREKGFHQILWLFGDDCVITEAGASNFFVVWRAKEDGRLQVVTADLNEKIVLDGVTRRSTLELLRTRLSSTSATAIRDGLEPVEVVERKFTMLEIEEAHREGRLVEAFAAGTAWFIAPVGHIQFRGRDLQIDIGADGLGGQYTARVKTWLKNIMLGEGDGIGNEWGVVVDES